VLSYVIILTKTGISDRCRLFHRFSNARLTTFTYKNVTGLLIELSINDSLDQR